MGNELGAATDDERRNNFYTVELNGEPSFVFRADSNEDALSFIQDENCQFRDELKYRHFDEGEQDSDGVIDLRQNAISARMNEVAALPLYSGHTNIAVRPANVKEIDTWKTHLDVAQHELSRDGWIEGWGSTLNSDDWSTWLVPSGDIRFQPTGPKSMSKADWDKRYVAFSIANSIRKAEM